MTPVQVVLFTTLFLVVIAWRIVALRGGDIEEWFRPQLERLEDRVTPSTIAQTNFPPQVVMVYESGANAGSYDQAINYLAHQVGGQVVASVVLPNANYPLNVGLALHKIPYFGPNTLLVEVAPPGQPAGQGATGTESYHTTVGYAFGQVAQVGIPGDSPGHGQWPGVSFDFFATTAEFFSFDPGVGKSGIQNVPGFGNVYVDAPFTINGGETLKTPNPQALDFAILLFFEYYLQHGGSFSF